MNEPVRQHLVPKVYLRNFAEFKRKDWYTDVFDKKTDKLFNANIKNVCVVNDFYTFEDLEPEKQRFLERYFGNHIESDFRDVYQSLVNFKINSADDAFKIKVITFVMSQFVRTSKLTNHFNNFWNQALERGHQMLDPSRPEQIIEFEGGGHIDFAGKTLGEVQKASDNENRKHINLKNMETFYKLAQRRKDDIIAVYRVHREHFLITSDNPVVSSNFMFDPASHFSMPLDAKHMLLLMPYTDEFRQNRNVINRTDMLEEMSYLQTITSNIRQVENAERYVIGTKSHINKVLQTMENLDGNELSERSLKFVERIHMMRENTNPQKT
jgi:hypothetical protein